MNISILGAGAWGTALAVNLSTRHRVTLWARDAKQITAMQASRCNQRYLPEITLPQELQLTADWDAACSNAEIMLVTVPISALRTTLQRIAAAPAIPVIWACKGFEAGTANLPHQVVGHQRLQPHFRFEGSTVSFPFCFAHRSAFLTPRRA